MPSRPQRVERAEAPNAPLRLVRSPRHNLPPALTSFIGREGEQVEVKRLLFSTRLLTITGAGGSGKTRLALEIAADLVETFADGVWLVDLSGLADPTLVPQAVAVVLDAREQPGRPVVETLVESLRSREMLLVLDNCEHVVLACADLALPLLRACPDLHILATSQEPLHIAGEVAWPIPLLSVPPETRQAGADAVADTALSEAVQLFVERAQAVVPAFELNEANAPAVTNIVRRLDGLPLAIELAAARVKLLSPQEIVTRLDTVFRLLTGGHHGAPPRHQTLRAAVDWSYTLLPPREQALLRRLAVFAGGFTLDAVEAVAEDIADQAGDATLDLLDALVQKSLVLVENQAESTRYRLLDTVRQYGVEKLGATGEATRVRERHLAWCLTLAEQAEPELRGPRQADWLRRLESDHDNIRQALGWARAEGQQAVVQRFLGALWRFWWTRGLFSEGLSWATFALNGAAGDATPETQRVLARAFNGAGNLAWGRSDYATARAYHEAGLALWRALDDQRGIAVALGNLGILAKEQSEYGAARAYHAQSLALSRALGDQLSIAYSLNNLGLVAYLQGDYTEARALFQESLTIRRTLGDERGVATLIGNLGLLALHAGDLVTAEPLLQDSLARQRKLGNTVGIANALNDLGNLAAARGDYAMERAFYSESLSLRREVGDKAGEAKTLHDLGRVALDEQKWPEARSCLEESLIIRRDLGNQHEQVESVETLAALALVQGAADRATRLLSVAARTRETGGMPAPHLTRPWYERALATAQTQLGDATFAAVWQAARALTLDQAVALALAPAPVVETRHVASPPAASLRPPGGLTSREREVAALIVQGKSNEDIANAMSVVVKTVEKHITNILGKLGFENRAQIAAWAVDQGLASAPEDIETQLRRH